MAWTTLKLPGYTPRGVALLIKRCVAVEKSYKPQEDLVRIKQQYMTA